MIEQLKFLQFQIAGDFNFIQRHIESLNIGDAEITKKSRLWKKFYEPTLDCASAVDKIVKDSA